MNFVEAVRLLKADKENFIVRKSKEEDQVFLNDDSGRLKTNSCLLTNDILANDWEIYEAKTKLHTFEEALKAYKLGNNIRRKGDETIYRYRDYCEFDRYDVLANDWIIIDNKE